MEITYSKKIILTDKDIKDVYPKFDTYSNRKKLEIVNKLADIEMEELIAEINETDFKHKDIRGFFSVKAVGISHLIEEEEEE
jgi:hypothetical protein